MKKDSTFREVPITQIKVGVRRREDCGVLSGLRASIEAHGLINPVTLDAAFNLIAGERRLRVCVELGWETIPANVYASLSENERRRMELAENQQRKAFTEYEESKTLVDLAAQAVRDLEEASSGPRVGQPASSERAVIKHLAETKGVKVSRTTLQRAKTRVAAVERDPSLAGKSQRAALVQTAAGMRALDCGVTLETHERIRALVASHGFASQRAVIESAVEVLYNDATGKFRVPLPRGATGARSMASATPTKARTNGACHCFNCAPAGWPKLQTGDLCDGKAKGALCKGANTKTGHHGACPVGQNCGGA